jgi:hypothetical protein
MLKIITSLALFILAFIACASGFAQTFINGHTTTTLDSPQLVVYGIPGNVSSAVKSGAFQCDPRYFPALPKALGANDWAVCWVYPIQGPDTCVPKLAGGTGVGFTHNEALGLNSYGWVSWWCPNADPIKSVPVVMACAGAMNCADALLKFAASKSGFADAAKSTFTTTVIDPVLLPVWSDPASVAKILAGRP